MKYVSVIGRRRLMAAVAAAGWLAPSLSMADHDVWKSAASGTWSAGANWVDGSSPDTVFDDATINLPGAYTISFSADPDPIEKVTVAGGAHVTFASSSRPPSPIVPRTLRLTSLSSSISVGNGSLTLGSTSGGIPSTNTPFHLNADGPLSVGGTLNVKFGSHVSAASLFPRGQLNITAAGSSVTATNHTSYEGAVNVTLGGLLQTGNDYYGGAMTVSGAGSRWLSAEQLQIGFYDGFSVQNGAVSVTGGGLVESGSTILGDQLGTTGTVTVTDSGSLWKSTMLTIGGQGPGTMNVQPGGTVSAVDATVIASGGRLRLQGGTFDTGDLSFDGPGQFEWTSGTLHVGTYHGDFDNLSGTLAPGHSAGVTNVLGEYGQGANATLEIEIGGAAQGTEYDVINSTEGIFLGGQLDLKLLGGFIPTPSQTFVIMSADIPVAGAFANVANGARLAAMGGGSFRVNYGAGSAFDPTLVVLSAFQSSVTGDFDVDGDVDGNDILVWQRGGSPNPNSAADLAAWKGNFGFPALAASGAVPEPAGRWLAVLAISWTPYASTLRRRERSLATR